MFARKCCELVNLVHILNLVNIKQLSRSSFCLFYELHKQTWTQRRVQICKQCLTLHWAWRIHYLEEVPAYLLVTSAASDFSTQLLALHHFNSYSMRFLQGEGISRIVEHSPSIVPSIIKYQISSNMVCMSGLVAGARMELINKLSLTRGDSSVWGK